MLTISSTTIPDTAGHQMAVQFSTSPSVCIYTTWGKQNKRNMHWNEQQTSRNWRLHRIKFWSQQSELKVHRLLTYCSTSCYQTCHWWHVRVSAVERISASAHEAIKLLECETSDFISPDLWSPTALTSVRSITSSGGHATAGLSDYVQECGWTQEATGWNLDWSGAEHYWHCCQQWRKRLHACARAKGRYFEHLL